MRKITDIPEVNENNMKMSHVFNKINTMLSKIHNDKQMQVDENFLRFLEEEINKVFKEFEVDFKQNLIIEEGTPAQLFTSLENNQPVINVILNKYTFGVKDTLQIDVKELEAFKRYYFMWYELMRLVQNSMQTNKNKEWRNCLEDVHETQLNFLKRYMNIDVKAQILEEKKKEMEELGKQKDRRLKK